ncbi:MAG: sulfite exporter TauE/SafE family protein [Oligoflexia bacterium]|nr:sulfite exporter TauE/SafE family protein [Oligoflexia bacterium]
MIPWAVLVASLAGSAHCVGMCGPLVTAASRGPVSVLAYHLGRLGSYALLGLLAGLAGDTLFPAQAGGRVPAFFQLFAALALGGAFIALGIQSWRGKGAHLWALPPGAARMIPRLLAGEKAAFLRAGAVGFLSALLPCGWLHAFVLAAVTTRDALAGAALLALFWAGTVPALTVAPVIVLRVLKPLARRAPKLTGILFMSIGLLAIGTRVPKIFAKPACHGAAASGVHKQGTAHNR